MFTNIAVGINADYDAQSQIEALKKQYPNLIFKEISYSEYQALKVNERNNSEQITILAQNNTNKQKNTDERPKEKPKSYSSGNKPGGSGNINIGGDDLATLALVLFVVVGVILVGVLIFSGGKILYDSVTNKHKFPVLVDTSIIYSSFIIGEQEANSTSYDSNTGEYYDVKRQVEFGALYGVRFMSGLIDNRTNKRATDTGIAITTEIGLMDIKLNLSQKESNNPKKQITTALRGEYILIGPSFRYYPNVKTSYTRYLGAELLVGKTHIKEIDLFSVARAFVSLGGKNIHMIFHIGATYLNLEEKYTLIRSSSQENFNLIWGGELGYHF